MTTKNANHLARMEKEWSRLPLTKRYFYFYSVLVLIVAVIHNYRGA